MSYIVEKQAKRVETYSEPKIDPNLFRKRSDAKTYKGWLIGMMKKTRDNGNLELCMVLQTCYNKYMDFAKTNERTLIELEIIDGWKGQDLIQIHKGFNSNFLIKTHNKDKETGKVTTSNHEIPYENVNKLLFFIKKWEIGEKHKCYEFTELLGEKTWEDVIGKRTKIYFPLYYFPIKILEKLKIIKYSGRGVITRII